MSQKPGYKTTEFAGMVVAMAWCVVDQTISPETKAAAMATISSIYTAARAWVKKS